MARKRKAGSQSAGYHADLSIPGYQPKTPTVAPPPSEAAKGPAGDYAGAGREYETAVKALPAAAQAVTEAATQKAAAEEHAARVAKRAETRQKRLVSKYVTHAYSRKLKKQGVPAQEVDAHIAKAKDQLEKDREALLSHPAVKEANAEGKVLGGKGLRSAEGQSKLLKTPTLGLGPVKGGVDKPRHDVVLDFVKGAWEAAGRNQPGADIARNIVGSEAKNLVGAVKESYEDQISGRSQLEPPSAKQIQAVALIPGVGAGGDAVRLGTKAAEAIPAVAKGVGKAAKDIPDFIRGAPELARSAAKAAPGATKAAVKATPKVAKSAAKATPNFAGRRAAQGADNAYHAVGGLAAIGAAQRGGLEIPGGAILEGQGKAFAHHPGKVLSSTANLAPALLTGAFQLPVAAGASVVTGSTKPLEGAANEQVDFLKHFAETYGSGDAKKIEQATLEEGLLPEVLLAPLAAKGIERGTRGLRGAVRGKVEDRRAPATDAEGNVLTHEHGGAVKRGRQRVPEPSKVTRLGEHNVHRREEAFHASTTNDTIQLEHARRREHIDKHARKAAGTKTVVREGLGPKGKDTLHQRPPDYIPFLNRAGIDLHNPDAALREIQHYAEKFKGLEHPSKYGVNPEALTARDAVKFFTDHPEELKNKDLAAALDEFRSMQNGEKGLRSLSTSERNRYLAHAVMHDIPDAKDRVPVAARAHTDATTREGAWEDLKARRQQAKEHRREADRLRVKARRTPKALSDLTRTLRKEKLRAAKLRERLAFRERDDRLRQEKAAKREAFKAGPKKGQKRPQPAPLKQMQRERTELLKAEANVRGYYSELRAKTAAHESKSRSAIDKELATAQALEKGAADLHDELKNFTRPGAKANPNAKRTAYDEALEKEMVAEARASLRAKGLHPEPAYMPDTDAIGRATPDETASGGPKPLPGGAKINEGYNWRHGLTRQGYEHMMNEGILRQVARNHQFENARRFRADRGIQFEGEFQHTGKGWAKAFDQGVMSRRDVALVPTQVVNRLEKATQGGDPTEYEAALAEMQAARKVDPKDAQSGTIYEAYPKAAYDEWVQQAQKTNIPAALRKANRFTSMNMLSTPAFVGAQVVAETAQAIAEVNPARMIQGLHAYNKLTPEQKLRISGASGETAKAIFSPEELQTTLGSYNEKPFTDALGFFRRNVFGRSAKSFATLHAAGELDRLKGSYIRRGALTGQIMRDLNGTWAKGRKLLKLQTAIQKQIGHLKPHEQLAWIAEHPKVLDRYQKDLHDAMGGWGNLTKTGKIPESVRAATLVFYPYLRMSIQWPLKYAMRHPIKATALAYLAAENNFALKEALEGDPSFLNYAQIPVYGVSDDGKPTTINLSRIAPGGNALTTAVQGSGSLLGALQPVLAAGIEGLTGKGPLGEIEGGPLDYVKAAGASILSLSPYVRAADTLKGQKDSGQSEYGVLGKRANIALNPLAALSSKLKGSKGEQLIRSLAFSFLPQNIDHQRDYAKLGRILTKLGDTGSSAQAKQQATKGTASEQRAVRAKVEAMQKENTKAEGELEKLYAKYGLSKVAARSLDVYKYTHPYPDEEKKGPYEGSGYEGSGYEGSGYGGGGSKEKPIPVPNKTDGIGFKLPGLGGIVGDIASPLAALVGGTKASAAELPKGKGSKAKVKVPRIEGVDTPGEATEFAQYLSKYTGLDPQFVGAWVKSEGGGTANGGEAGKNNWLGVGYPGEKTPFSQSAYFNGDAQQAARATAEWMKGKIGHEYGYRAAPSIQAIIPAARGKGPQAALNALSASGWGTNVTHVAENLAGVSAQGKTLADAHQAGGKVYVRADAKGMVQWAHSLLGTQEGSPKQIRWAAQSGVSPEEPWCSEFIAAGLARRGLPKPSNPAYSGTWLTWKGGQHIGTDLAKAKPGDVVVFGSNPGSTTHVGLYVGSGKMISGNWSDEVAAANVSDDSEPIAGIVRPKYKGGKVAVKAGTPLLGSVLAPSGELVSAPAGVPSMASTESAAKERQAKQRKGKPGLTGSQRLKLVNEITSGNLEGLGIPGYTPKVGPAVADLAALGSDLEDQRRKLARL